MSSDKKMNTDNLSTSDYANFAFNPYAISTEDLTKAKNGDKSLVNGGYERDENPQYEDTNQVVEQAGLGRRKKENLVYEAAGKKIKPRREQRQNLPPLPPPEYNDTSKETKSNWKLPFLILSLMTLISLIGAILGVLAFFKDNKCSCKDSTSLSLPVTQETIAINISRLMKLETAMEETKTALEKLQMMYKTETNQKMVVITKIQKQVDEFNATLKNLQRTYDAQNMKFPNNNLTSTNNNQTDMQEKLKNTIESINSSLISKVENINKNITSLKESFEDKLRNISKQIGPRGFNGTQGPKGEKGDVGPQGIGNVSACIMNKLSQKGTYVNEQSIAKIEYTQRQGWKVISAVCSTTRAHGTLYTVLSDQDDTYICTCSGKSTSNASQEIECVIYYWECPVNT